jgi:hypothetical protein
MFLLNYLNAKCINNKSELDGVDFDLGRSEPFVTIGLSFACACQHAVAFRVAWDLVVITCATTRCTIA